MAVQTKSYCRISMGDATSFVVFVEYENTDFRVTNDDGAPDDFRVIRFFGTNHSTVPLTIRVQRGNGQKWFEVVISAGESFSWDAGGPFRYESDVPVWTYT